MYGLAMPRASSLGWFALSWALHSGTLIVFVFLVVGWSFSYSSAALVSLFCVFAASLAVFSLSGTISARAFLGGGVAALLWFPVGVALLDWAVGGGVSPSYAGFYANAFHNAYSPQVLAYTLKPAAALIASSLGGLGVGLWTRQTIRRSLTLARKQK
jgi:hypothetical protein